MLFKSVLAALCLTAASTAWYIPEGQAEGTYLVRRNEDGVEEHVRMSRAPAAEAEAEAEAVAEAGVSPMPVSELEKRTGYVTFCGCDLRMDSFNCDRAVEGVKNQINARGGTFAVQNGQSIYTIYGSVVAFVCNFAGRTYSTTVPQFTDSLRTITDRCGRYVPGAAYNGDNNLIHGYQNWNTGQNFCGNWDKGKYDHC